MKEKIIIATILISVIFPISLLGQTNFYLPNPGLTPDSPFYFFDIAFEKINLFFTFNIEKKIQKTLLYTEERLAEVEAMAEKNKPEATEKAIVRYEDRLNFVNNQIKKLKDEGVAEDILTLIAEKTTIHQEILVGIYNKVSDDVKGAIEKAIEISASGQERALAQITELKSGVKELEQKITELEQSQSKAEDEQIEALRRKIEGLKQQQASQQTQPQVIEKVVEKIIEVPPPTPSKNIKPLSKTEIFEKVSSAVVLVTTSRGSGSGMIIESSGIILTNAHVVEGVSGARIKLNNGNISIASVMGRDENIDLALLKINATNLPIVELGNSDTNSLKVGADLFAFGFPLDFSHTVTVTRGILSARQNVDGTMYLQTDASIHPGNSGGPLVNDRGEVIGINTAGVVAEGIRSRIGGTGIGFAIPANIARGLIPELKAGRNVVVSIVPDIPSLPPTPSPTPTPEPEPEPKFEPEPTPNPEIISVNTSTETTSARIEWETNIPTNGKVFVWNDSYIKKSFSSKSKLSTTHIANIYSGLFPDQTYFYEIEAITSDSKFVKKSGQFSTSPLPPIVKSVDIYFSTDDSWSYAGANHNCGLDLTRDSVPNGGINGCPKGITTREGKNTLAWFLLNAGNRESLDGIYLKSFKVKNTGTASLLDAELEAVVEEPYPIGLQEGSFHTDSLTHDAAEFSINPDVYPEGKLYWQKAQYIRIKFNVDNIEIGETLGLDIVEMELGSNNSRVIIQFENTFPLQSENWTLLIKCRDLLLECNE